MLRYTLAALDAAHRRHGACSAVTRFALTLNAGSSSIKFALYALSGAAQPLAKMTGQVEMIGFAPRLVAETAAGDRIDRCLKEAGSTSQSGAMSTVTGEILDRYPGMEIAVVGHRIVHGGPDYTTPIILDDTLLKELEEFSPFAPVHQPHNLEGVQIARSVFPEALQIACFDTAFHRDHPRVNDVYALPRRFYDLDIKRYGFHGLSYEYVSGALQTLSPTLHSGRVIVAHLGNGVSMCALLHGRSVGSTMGFTALDGLPMGTRCGQLDPGVVLYMMEQQKVTLQELTDILYRESGLLGLSGISSDMRDLQETDAPEAKQAIDYYVFRIRRELGALSAVLGGLDALVFTGGIGENSAEIRARVCEGQGWIGIDIDRQANAENGSVISSDLSRVRVMIIPTNEELVIARAAVSILAGDGSDHGGTAA